MRVREQKKRLDTEEKSGKAYRNYIFDLYGTLVNIHTDEEREEVWEKLALFFEYYGAHYYPGELKDMFRRLAACGEDVKGGHEAYPEIRLDEVFWKLFRARGVSPQRSLVLRAGQFFRIMTTERICLYDGVKEILEGLRKRKKGIYLLSNAQRIFTEYELDMLDIARYFDGIVISSDYGVKKPSPRLFRILLEKYRLDPRECLMIGHDAEADIAGARRVGIDTFYVRSDICPEHGGEVKATYVELERNPDRIRKILGLIDQDEEN